jgi:hypothetical protein
MLIRLMSAPERQAASGTFLMMQWRILQEQFKRGNAFERDNQDGDFGSQRDDDCRAASQRQGVCAWRATIRMTT